MASTVHGKDHRGRRSASSGHIFGRRMLVWLLLPMLVAAAVSAVLYAYAQGQGAAATPEGASSSTRADTAPPPPADRFMQSIITDDGALGWRQLCPNVQAALPLDQLVQQADKARAEAARQGIRFTVGLMSAQPQQGGGEQRVYVVTAHWPNGAMQQRTFIVLTLPSGCVEDAGYR